MSDLRRTSIAAVILGVGVVSLIAWLAPPVWAVVAATAFVAALLTWLISVVVRLLVQVRTLQRNTLVRQAHAQGVLDAVTGSVTALRADLGRSEQAWRRTEDVLAGVARYLDALDRDVAALAPRLHDLADGGDRVERYLAGLELQARDRHADLHQALMERGDDLLRSGTRLRDEGIAALSDAALHRESAAARTRDGALSDLRRAVGDLRTDLRGRDHDHHLAQQQVLRILQQTLTALCDDVEALGEVDAVLSGNGAHP